MTNPYETILHDTLNEYLLKAKAVDEHLPETPDIEELWAKIGEAYLPDGVREFQSYPSVSLGWIMYVGMAIAKYWDVDWEVYSKVDNLYQYMLQKTDFDHLDDYIRETVLGLNATKAAELEQLVRGAAELVNDRIRHLGIEPGTEMAFRAFVAAIHQMYLMGAAVQLKTMGYHMTKMG